MSAYTMKFEKEHYRPLPKGLTIKKSPIDGLGLFTTKSWDAGEELGVSHVLNRNLYYDINEWIRTPLGGFINHSDNPNCFMVYEKINNSQFHFKRKAFAIRPIKKGEEITAYYSLEKTKPNV